MDMSVKVPATVNAADQPAMSLSSAIWYALRTSCSLSRAMSLSSAVGAFGTRPTLADSQVTDHRRDRVIYPPGSTQGGIKERARRTRRSPDLHAAIDHEVDAGHVGALVGGQEQRDVRHLVGQTEPAKECPVAHRA